MLRSGLFSTMRDKVVPPHLIDRSSFFWSRNSERGKRHVNARSFSSQVWGGNGSKIFVPLNETWTSILFAGLRACQPKAGSSPAPGTFSMRTRIAPTPSGHLHAGNGTAFVATWKIARSVGAKLLLRIDDLDAERVRPVYVEDIFETLRWLGIHWDEGPKNANDLREHWSQHLRLARYGALIDRLREGGHLYACDCSRAVIAQRGGSTEYDGHCRERGLDLDLPDVAWRLRLPKGETVAMHIWPNDLLQELPLDQPDPVIRQRNGRPAYQTASLSDDVDFGIDLIVRGADLLPSTLIQLHLARVLDLKAFTETRFLHHPLITDALGGKLSKSHGAGSLKAMRETGGAAGTVHASADRLLRDAGVKIP